MEPEPTLVAAEPVHEPENVRALMRQKLVANLAAVGGLTELCDLAHKMQPDLVPAEANVTALLRAVVALTLVPQPMEAAPQPEISSPTLPTPQPTPAEPSPGRRQRPRMMRTPSLLGDPVTNGGRRQRELLEAETISMAVDVAGSAASSRARAAGHLASLLEHETHAEGLGGAFGDDEPESADPAGAAVLWQALAAETHKQARETAQEAATAQESGAHQVLPSLHVAAQEEELALCAARRGPEQ